ncbi:hypothetical protein EOE67_16275 [Rheinheimera riviphila]|uniref:Uncharacterized protein n=1 Tax=Rheinheimera riviphila TaxID=1834037 RepID=A0A437QGE4_9GAMM|nr:hypothetical protein [Rheinheimera riviphila]RVU33572.1 hypothetical protein EOE67_16275 [Rheinheimera riviphila]
MTESKQQTPPSSKLGLTAEEAAGASIAQSIALAAQNEVDAYRNQNTVNMVAMGVAYAKWLQNPTLSKQYSEVVDAARLSMGNEESETIKAFAGGVNKTSAHTRAESNPPPQAAAAASAPGPGTHSLPARVFSYFLSPPAKPEQS